MRRTIYSSEQIAKLEQNPCVWRVSQRMIHYTYEFKKRALDLYAQGIKLDDIWKQGYCRHTFKNGKFVQKYHVNWAVKSIAKFGKLYGVNRFLNRSKKIYFINWIK